MKNNNYKVIKLGKSNWAVMGEISEIGQGKYGNYHARNTIGGFRTRNNARGFMTMAVELQRKLA